MLDRFNHNATHTPCILSVGALTCQVSAARGREALCHVALIWPEVPATSSQVERQGRRVYKLSLFARSRALSVRMQAAIYRR